MSTRGRSLSPRKTPDGDVDMDNPSNDKANARVVVVTGLSRNVVEPHLQAIFSFYGEISKIDLPLYQKSGQNRGKAALEYADSSSAHKAASHMNNGQLDGQVLTVELSSLPIRSRSRSPRVRRGAGVPRARPLSYSRSRSRSPPPRAYGRGPRGSFRDDPPPRYGDSYRGDVRGGRWGRPPPPRRDVYRPYSRSRSRSPPPRRAAYDRPPPRRRSPSYERGGTTYGRRGRSRSRSFSVRSSRSRSRSLSYSRSRSLSSDSRYTRSRSRTRSRSVSRGRRSPSRDDIRDSRSRSPR